MATVNHEKAAGIAGLLFAAGVATQNGALLQGMPLPGAPTEAVLSFYVSHAWPATIATGWVAINVPLLLVFGSGIAERLGRRAAGSLWSRVGFGGIVLLAAAFSVTTLLQAVLLARADVLHRAGMLGLVWDLHAAAFAMSGTALSGALGAYCLGSLRAEVVPRWVAIAGLVGAVLLVLSGTSIVRTVSGGPGIFLQLAGFVTWLLFVVTGSLRLLRAEGEPLPAHAQLQVPTLSATE